MDKDKRKALENAGWKFGDAADFLEMNDDERNLLDESTKIIEWAKTQHPDVRDMICEMARSYAHHERWSANSIIDTDVCEKMIELLDAYDENMLSKIPKGPYCYDENGLCPWWSKRDDKDHQVSGYCKYLNEGDWETKGVSHLWDQVKECDFNLDEENDDV